MVAWRKAKPFREGRRETCNSLLNPLKDKKNESKLPTALRALEVSVQLGKRSNLNAIGSSRLSTFIEFAKMADPKETFARITSWMGFVSGVLSLVVFFFMMPSVSPRILMFSENFTSDFNRNSWRFAMFSFVPDVFVDIWTPFVMGLISICCHFGEFDLGWMCRTYAHFFIWNFVMALFGQIGYSGIIGIIASAVTLLCTLCSLICAVIVRDKSAKLGLGALNVTK
ncbi:hypothetical protein Esti_006377 [Eimeria stiedai]